MSGKTDEIEWRMVRLRLSTIKRLEAMRERLRTVYNKHAAFYVTFDNGEASNDALIAELLRRDEQHQARSRKAKKRMQERWADTRWTIIP